MKVSSSLSREKAGWMQRPPGHPRGVPTAPDPKLSYCGRIVEHYGQEGTLEMLHSAT